MALDMVQEWRMEVDPLAKAAVLSIAREEDRRPIVWVLDI
jgi:hypothetical protein